jgi:hypothetical protein
MAGIRPENLRTSDIKSRLLNVSQTSLYRLSIPALPSAVDNFVKQRGIVGATQVDDISLLCTETSLPGSSLATHEVTNDYHGVTEKMAYRRIYDDTLDCTFYVDREYRVIELFDGWINYIVGEGSITGGFSREDFRGGTAHHRILYPKTYKQNIFVSKFERDHHSPKGSSTFMEYTFVDAFPTNIVSMPVSYDQSQILKCTISFSYTRYVRERKGVSVAPTNPNPNAPGIAELASAQVAGSVQTGPTDLEYELLPVNGQFSVPSGQGGASDLLGGLGGIGVRNPVQQ